jgi:hypothetical protein
MGNKNTRELRASAEMYRGLSAAGGDPQLRVALLELAKEFDREAELLEVQLREIDNG